MHFFSTKSNFFFKQKLCQVVFLCRIILFLVFLFCFAAPQRQKFVLAPKSQKEFVSFDSHFHPSFRNVSVSHQTLFFSSSSKKIFTLLRLFFVSCCAPEFRVLSVSGFGRPESWRTEGRSLGASGCRSGAGLRRRCAETERSCSGWWSPGPGNPGSPVIEDQGWNTALALLWYCLKRPP